MSGPDSQSQALSQVMAADGDGVTLRVKVVPNASRNKLAGLLGDRLKVAVNAPPEQGKANDAVCQLLAKAFGLSARQVSVVAGQAQPAKTIRLDGVGLGQAMDRLRSALA